MELVRGIGDVQQRWASVHDFVRGEALEAELTPKHFFAIGALTGRLHNHSHRFEPPSWFARPRVVGARLAPLGSAPPETAEIRHLARTAEGIALGRIESGSAPSGHGLVHGDLHLDNVLFDGADARPIDFDDCRFAYYLRDLTLALSSWELRVGFTSDYSVRDMRLALLSGYEQTLEDCELTAELFDCHLAVMHASRLESLFRYEGFPAAAVRVRWIDYLVDQLRRSI